MKALLPPDFDMTSLTDTVEQARRANESRAKMTEEERQLSRGVQIEQTAEATLLMFEGKKRLKAEEKEAKRHALIQKSLGLSMQGRFWEAVEICPDKALKKEFSDTAKAIQLDDDSKCNCPDSVAELYRDEKGNTKARAIEGDDRTPQHKGSIIAVTPRFERKQIYSPKHGCIVSLVECSCCGHKNARLMKSRLAGVDEIAKANTRAEAQAQKGRAARPAYPTDAHHFKA